MDIILIYADQMRYDAMGNSGNPCIKTPNLDRLAREGIAFDQAHTSFPLCCPFRASLMTGKYAHATGMLGNHYPIPLDQTFLPQVLGDAGWRTGYIGKWHLNGGRKYDFVPPDERLGFEEFIGFSRGHNYEHSLFYRNDDPTPRTSRRYEADYQTDHLIEFLSKKDDRPNFAMICYGIPHPPLLAPAHHLGLYSPDEVPVRANTPDDDEAQANARRFLAGYYGLVSHLDFNIGRLLEWLDSSGRSDDTMVILVSDHGDMAGEHGRYAKKTWFDASMHVPLLIRHPKTIEAARRTQALVDPSVDLMPTLLEYAGLPVPDCVQGLSFKQCLCGSQDSARDAIHYEIITEREGPERHPEGERGIRTRDWLYVRTQAQPIALYNLRTDPLENHNLVDDPAHSQTLSDLDKALNEHMQATKDSWDLEAQFPPVNFQSHKDGGLFAQQVLQQALIEK